MSDLQESWPSGATWVFQGTIAEDATAGTHICTLTVSPSIGNELQVLYGSVIVGNTATAQVVTVSVTDGTNTLVKVINGASFTSANSFASFPASGDAGSSTSAHQVLAIPFMVSGTMQVVLTVSTAAVSVTQTFALVCRFRGMAKPTAVLNDTIGTSTNTVNTNQVF